MTHLYSMSTLKIPSNNSTNSLSIAPLAKAPVWSMMPPNERTRSSPGRVQKWANSSPRSADTDAGSGQPRSLHILPTPCNASKIRTPKAQTSPAHGSKDGFMPCRISGAAKGIVPHCPSARALLTSKAIPKSTSLAFGLSSLASLSQQLKTTLSCLTSRWAMPMRCRYAKAAVICSPKSHVCAEVKVSWSMMKSHIVVVPANSMWMQTWCRVCVTLSKRMIPG
mmetsp:Transcript_28368/g.81544  ORF Transcript_28368/g.81544 Transcript_28368/m.81544 type:complete len:223 (+) Transcript_28368:170-838(+)